MKKFIFAACAAMVLFFGSCQKSAKQQYLDLIKEATEKIEKAQTVEEISTIADDCKKKAEAITTDKAELEKLEQDKDVKEAAEKLLNTAVKKGMEIGSQMAAPAVEEQPAEPAADEQAAADEELAE